jgi:SAM-dependent methyltransferase
MGLDQVRQDWTRLGADDPLWAVLVSPENRNGRWDAGKFLQTGRTELAAVMAHLRTLGIEPGHGPALDFGCGVGRLSAALAEYVDGVVGVDISTTMLARAREMVVDPKCTFVLNDRPDLSQWEDGTFGLAYSSLVLQHIPTQLALDYVSELVRVLRPGGALVAQMATRPNNSIKGRIASVAPRRMLRIAQQHLLRYPAPMDMYPTTSDQVAAAAAVHGGRVLDAVDEPMYGGHWRYRRYYVVRG